MHRKGHIGLGHLLYSPLAFVLALSEAWTLLALGLVGITFFSYAPDFDLQMPLVDHRGITHTYLAAGVAGVLSMVVLGWLAVAGIVGTVGGLPPLVSTILVALFGFAVGALGVLSHLLGDVLTPMGINPWQPFGGETVSLELVYASNRWANGALSLAGGLALVAAIAGGALA